MQKVNLTAQGQTFHGGAPLGMILFVVDVSVYKSAGSEHLKRKAAGNVQGSPETRGNGRQVKNTLESAIEVLAQGT